MKKGKTHTMKSLLSIMLRIGTFGFAAARHLYLLLKRKSQKIINLSMMMNLIKM